MSFQFGNKISLAWKKLKSGEYTVREFQVNKLWELSSYSASPIDYRKTELGLYRTFFPENYKYFGQVANVSSSLYERVFTTQSLDPKVLWYYMDHNYYSPVTTQKTPLTITDDNLIANHYLSGSLFVIPRDMFGEGIKKKTVEITIYDEATGSMNYVITDDGRGNLIDNSFDSTKIIDRTYELLYVGFNDKYREYNVSKNYKTDYVVDESPFYNTLKIKNKRYIRYENGIETNDTNEETGTSAYFNGTYLSVNENQRFNFHRGRDFAFSFWVKLPENQTDTTYTYNSLFDKKTMEDVIVDNPTNPMNTANSDSGNLVEMATNSKKFPFDIYLNNQTSGENRTITFKQGSELIYSEVSSSTLTANEWHHIVCQKTGSNFQIWVDGILENSQNKIITTVVENNNKFYIAGNGTDFGKFNGNLDEIRIYRNALTSTEISNLYDNSFEHGYAYQTSRIGNVFYGHGIMCVSDPRPKYKNVFLGKTGNYDYDSGKNGFTLKFRSTVTYWQHEVICKIRKNEFNFTQNVSLYTNPEMGSMLTDTYATNPNFNPYVTTIGLYNNNRELVAIGKFANPIEKRDDVDMNFIVRFDI
jgi:hypothetical protein